MPNVVVGARTHVGNHRALNEDSYFSGERVWIVADGMGGHAAGDVASGLAVDSLKELDAGGPLKPGAVAEAVQRANAAILARGLAQPATRGMGTTVTGVAEVIVADVPHWAVFNVGDSRVYHYTAGALERATVDHSEVEELLAEGIIDAEQARLHPARHIITRSVGTRPAPNVDLWVLPQSPGERFLICSDGLSAELTDDEIAALLRDHPTAPDAAAALVDAVLATPARDNVTVLVIDVGGDDRAVGDEQTVPQARPEGESR